MSGVFVPQRKLKSAVRQFKLVLAKLARLGAEPRLIGNEADREEIKKVREK